ncbi:MAG: ABC transporter ATP-binding protein [Bacteroidetes bacterium]|nr:ABC transporter ATP-binding protein [Bacteroidota bacterium]
MISVKKISKTFDKTIAVKQLSFNVAEGETLILLGTSGCGKTTTLKMLNHLITPDEGSVFVNGKDNKLVNPEELRLGIGYVLQNHGLFPHYTIAQNMAIVPQLLKWEKEKIRKRTDELIEKLHLPTDIKNKFPYQLSGGQQQRVGLARALAANPPILLMDEPFGALDPITRNKIKSEFLTLDELQNKTIVMVTHDVQEAFELGDQICLMDEGEILQIGTPKELLEKPKSEKVKNFLKDQQSQLSLKTLSLLEIWPQIESIGKPPVQEVLDANEHHLWSVFEKLANQKHILLKLKKEEKTVTSTSLMWALEKYKTLNDGTN